jgi:O-antigen/teichoic acid export membrane protein
MYLSGLRPKERANVGAQISLRKTGLVVFAARIASVFTGLTFLIMMTRSLSPQQFGFYEVITDLVTFAAYPAGLVAFWATRDIARGKMFGRTAIVLNIALSAFGIAIYFALSYLSESRIPSASPATFFFAVLLVPVSYFNQAANAVVAGHKPVVLGYAVIFSEGAKLAVAYPLLIVFKVGIDGVILAVMVANLAQAVASAVLAGGALSSPINIEQGRRWLAHSWLPMLTTLPLMLAIADTYVASLAAADTTLVGHYQAAFSVATLAGYSLYLASAMYPLLLKGGSDDVTAMTLDLALAFGIPMAVGAAVLATPVLHLLSSSGQYLDASTALAILAIAALCSTVSSVFDQILLGKERVDVNEDARFRDYLRSSILFVAKVNISISVVYLTAVYLSVTGGIFFGASVATTLDSWALSQVGIFTIAILIKVRRVRTVGKLIIPRSIGYYAVGAGIMAVILRLLQGFISYHVGTFFLATELVLVGGVGLVGYGAFVLALDKPLRSFLRKALMEMFA